MAKNNRSGRGQRRQGVPYLGAPDSDAGIALVVGLGNPGRKYRNTRHNLGRLAAEAVIESSEVLARGKWSEGRLAYVSSGGRKFLVLTPETFMNLSGRAVGPVLERYRIEPSRMLVIHDDIDLPLGDVRVKEGGGTAGHRGLASLVETIGQGAFRRIRMGVGRPPGGVDAADYVLSCFSESESEQARMEISQVAEAILGEVTGAGGAS
ncbi:MAG: aminoacyl-tRNA hydrolase [Candidatus Geothermincolia bacterium]